MLRRLNCTLHTTGSHQAQNQKHTLTELLKQQQGALGMGKTNLRFLKGGVLLIFNNNACMVHWIKPNLVLQRLKLTTSAKCWAS